VVELMSGASEGALSEKGADLKFVKHDSLHSRLPRIRGPSEALAPAIWPPGSTAALDPPTSSAETRGGIWNALVLLDERNM